MNILEYENYQEKKDHTNLDFPYNTYLCSIPLDFELVPPHWHDEMEIIYIKKGRGIVYVDFKEYIVNSLSLVFILPGQLHSIEQYEDYTMDYENIIFDVSMVMSNKKDSVYIDFFRPLTHGKITVPTVFSQVYPYFNDLVAPIDACDEICKTKPQGYELYIKSMLFQFFFILDNRCRNLKAQKNNRKIIDKMKIIIKYVENNYAEKITIADIASVIGFSESHFMRYFKDTMGTSFIEYLKDYRLTMAARLLQSSDDSILTISQEVGFDNLSYFNRSFKSRYGMTPSQYRNN